MGNEVNKAPWHATALTIFPEMFPGPLGQSLAGRALEKGIWSLDAVNIRDFATDKHRSVDDVPFGGGAGMVMRPDVLDAAIRGCAGSGPLIYMTPRGRLMDQALVRELADGPGATILCGRFEGVDQRVLDAHGALEGASRAIETLARLARKHDEAAGALPAHEGLTTSSRRRVPCSGR